MPADAGPAAAAKPADQSNAASKTNATSKTNTATEDTVIAAERAPLARSREFLHLMRENALELAKNPMAGDRVSLEFLKADLYRRAEALKDLPDAPLFFGRLDYSELARQDEDFAGADFHIGRRHVHDPDGTPVVLDWRAPVSMPFSRASQPEPMGLTLRRRFGFSGGALTAYEDERVRSSEEIAAAPDRRDEAQRKPTSNLLISEIERPRSGPMRDIVATIQPEQDDIVRAGAATTVCVQGAPGTGKTAVGLHRVAYLLYAHKEQVTRRGVVVVGPNLAFLSYIRNVLPALGELDVTQTTVARLVASVPVRGTDTDEAAKVKGDARMAEVLRRALWASIRPPAQALVLSRGSRRLRVPAHELEALAQELRDRGVRYGTGRELLAHRVAHVLLRQLAAEAVRRRGKPAAAVGELDVGYRVPRQILDYASRLLPAIAPGLGPARSLRGDPNALAVRAGSPAD